MRKTAIIGAGASGCFCAIELKRRNPDMDITVYEAGSRAMAKLSITGGGRCNFTNTFKGIERLEEAYPRGAKLMKRALGVFNHLDTMEWFRREGIPCTIQDDNCVFPESQDAMQIVRTLERLLRNSGVKLVCNSRIDSVQSSGDGFILQCREESIRADIVVVSSGGGAIKLLDRLEIGIEKPVPSLFSFNINDIALRELMGIVAPDASVSLEGSSFKAHGALLITDWGMSGPAILKLSSYAARELNERGYKGKIKVNWCGLGEAEAVEFLLRQGKENGRKKLGGTPPSSINSRLWKHLMARAGIRADIQCAELGGKGINKLVNILTSDTYELDGRCAFKSEFVTCGGVSLSGIKPATMESRRYPGLYFTGEVLDIDAITGGFNLQAAWSTAMAAAVQIKQV